MTYVVDIDAYSRKIVLKSLPLPTTVAKGRAVGTGVNLVSCLVFSRAWQVSVLEKTDFPT